MVGRRRPSRLVVFDDLLARVLRWPSLGQFSFRSVTQLRGFRLGFPRRTALPGNTYCRIY